MIIEWIRSLLRGPPDEYRIIRGGPNEERAVIEKGLQDIPDPDLYILENDLEPGKYRCQAIRDNRFGQVRWVREVGNPESLDEIDDLRRELREIRGAVESSPSREEPSGRFDDHLKKATFESLLSGDLEVREAKAIAELSAAFDGGGQRGLSDQIEDPKDVGEIAGRSVLELVDDPSRLEQFSSSAGRAFSGFLDGALQEGEADQEEDLDEDDEGRSREIGGGPTTLNDLLEEGAETELPVPEGDGAEESEEAVSAESEAVSAEIDAATEPAVADGGEPDDDEPLPEEVANVL